MNRLIQGDFDVVARVVSDRSTPVDIAAVVYNPLFSSPPSQPVFLFEVPHLGKDGIAKIFPNGYNANEVPNHRFYDEGVDAMAKLGYALVGSYKNRLEVNFAVPEEMAVTRTTPDNVPIDAYQGDDFASHVAKGLRLHCLYNATIAEQVKEGARYIGSLDSMSPTSLKDDLGDQRDMIISLIAKNENSPRVQALKAALTEALRPELAELRDSTPHIINPYEFVAVNKPYGAQMFERLDLFNKTNLSDEPIVIEVRSDFLQDPVMVAKIARAIHTGIQVAYAGAKPTSVNGHDHRITPAIPSSQRHCD